MSWVAPYHDRMPVVLGAVERWLNLDTTLDDVDPPSDRSVSPCARSIRRSIRSRKRTSTRSSTPSEPLRCAAVYPAGHDDWRRPLLRRHRVVDREPRRDHRPSRTAAAEDGPRGGMRFRFFSPSACNQCANAKVTLLPVAGYNVRMTRRKSEITGHMNERDFPHLVELQLPPGGFLASARPNRAARDYSHLSCAVGTQLGPKTAPA
jgi:hypothetical protein